MPDDPQEAGEIIVYLGGGKGHWFAHAYDQEDNRHIWSAEDAPTVSQALSSVAEAVEEYVQP
jgi:isopentenyl phosphate kinase